MPDSIEASAPGKVVLWGEYAVLAGVPAAVMAIDCRAVCRITRRDRDDFLLSASGYPMPALEVPALTTGHLPASAALFGAAASAVQSNVPAGLAIHLDTGAFPLAGHKLGIGSSAAALVACYGALAACAGEPFDLGRAIGAHRRFQGSGSGLDVATAWHGGTVRFQHETVAPLALPASLRLRPR